MMKTRRFTGYALAFLVGMHILVNDPVDAGDVSCYTSNRGMDTMETATVILINDNAESVYLETLIADDLLERASGYQYICPRVIDRTSILFRYPQATSGRFHMNNVNAPLDIAFFDETGLLIQSLLMMPYSNGEERLYGPMQAFQFAIEARAGFFAERNLSAGKSKLELDSLP